MFAGPFGQAHKRPREEEEYDLNLDFLESESRHESKKLRALPFRTSPTLKHGSLFSETHAFTPRPQTLTPVDSSEDGSDDELPDSRPRHVLLGGLFSTHGDDDMDMAVIDAHMSSPLPWQEQHLSHGSDMPPPTLQFKRTKSPPRHTISTQQSSSLSVPNEINETGRLPTPIYGHFPQSSSGRNGSSRPGVPNAATLRMCAPISPIPASPMSPSDIAAESTWWQRRRLPSPAEDRVTDDVAMSSLGVIDTMLPRLNVSPPTSNPQGLPDELVAKSHQPDPLTNGRRPPSPFGRARSNATSTGTSGTAPSSTSRLSMGYRADCEKCIRRVPGHYTHILRN